MRNRYLLTGAMILLLVSAPYWIAQSISAPGSIFGGFLFNPLDGNSYLAKMQQGWAGSWTFTLPYSDQANEGAYLFLFYLFLGHVARWLGLSTLLVFHLTRVLSAVALLIALRGFFSAVFPDRPKIAFWAFLISAAGSGMGWLAALFGGFTSDFWVAEAYPFLSVYSNPHFPLGLALLLWFLTQNFRPFQSRKIPLLALAGTLMGIIFPFGVVVAVVVTLGMAAFDYFTQKKVRWQAALVFLLTGGLTILYQFVVIRTDPVLSLWDRQNQTPSPQLWDFLVSFLPWLLPAIWGVIQTMRRRNRATALLTGWLVLGALLIYLPFNLQRRFLFGYMIPVAGLAAYGLAESRIHCKSWASIAALCLTLPTLLVILSGGLLSVKNGESSLVIQRAEMRAYDYLRQHGQANDLVLASPESGMFLPAYTGFRVIYGHPFETVNAPAEEQAVEAFFSQPVSAESLDWARERGVRWILWGPRENDLGRLPLAPPAGLRLVFADEDVRLFELQSAP